MTACHGLFLEYAAKKTACSLSLAINRPIGMLVTSLNCVGDSVAALAVSESEGRFTMDVYNQ